MPDILIKQSIWDLPEHVGNVTVDQESRFWELADKRITGNILITEGCSHFELRNLYVKGSIRVMGRNWQAAFSNIFVDSSPLHGFWIGDAQGDACNALFFRNCFSRWAKNWGWLVTNQIAINLQSCSADQGGDGGFLFSSANGQFNLTAESNPVGAWFYDTKAGLLSGSFLTDNKEPLRMDERSRKTVAVQGCLL